MKYKYKIGDIVEHIESGLRARIQKVRHCLDDTQQLMVFSGTWWNSSQVKLVDGSMVSA